MQKTLRIIQVINVRWFNATAWYALSLSRLLVEAGHQVMVIALPGTDVFHKAQAFTGCFSGSGLNSSNPVTAFRALRQAGALLQEFRPHIVNCHRGEGMILWGLLKAAGHNFALVRTRGDQRPPKANIVNRWLYGRLAGAVIATNSRTAEQCKEQLRLRDSALYMIPGGVDRAAFAYDPVAGAAVRRGYGWKEEDLVVGLLGRFDPVKGHRELMDAFKTVKGRLQAGRNGPSLRLLLLGYPANDSLEDVRGWLHERNLDSCSVVTGRVQDPAAYISAMDLGVIASQGSEAIARAALEIMSCGVPLIGTDVGVMPDLLAREALVPPGQAAAFASLLERAVSDTVFRQTLRGQQEARMPAFSRERFLEQTLAVYEGVVLRGA